MPSYGVKVQVVKREIPVCALVSLFFSTFYPLTPYACHEVVRTHSSRASCAALLFTMGGREHEKLSAPVTALAEKANQ